MLNDTVCERDLAEFNIYLDLSESTSYSHHKLSS